MISKVSCIYAIENTVNGRRYVGSTNNFNNRKNGHVGLLRRNKHDNQHLQNAWNKYGEQSFIFVIVEEVEVEQLLDVEQKYLDENKDGYNIAKCAEAPTRGRKLSEETKAKISSAHIGKNYRFGYKHSDETKEKLSAAKIGKPGHKGSEKQRLATIASNKKRIGIKHSDEHKRKIGMAGIGRKHSEETKAKISAARIGKKYPRQTHIKEGTN